MVVRHWALHQFERRLLDSCDLHLPDFVRKLLRCRFGNSLDSYSVDLFLFQLLFRFDLLFFFVIRVSRFDLLFFFVIRVNRFIILSGRLSLRLINRRPISLRLLKRLILFLYLENLWLSSLANQFYDISKRLRPFPISLDYFVVWF